MDWCRFFLIVKDYIIILKFEFIEMMLVAVEELEGLRIKMEKKKSRIKVMKKNEMV